MNSDWQTQFRQIYDRGIAAYRAGKKSARAMFGPAEARFLETIGYTTQELFDFVEDIERYGEPDYATALAIAAIRHDYFHQVMQGRPAARKIAMDDLPAKAAEVDGIPWLPRLISKARAKLRGEMPDDLMYCCGGDRDFFAKRQIDGPTFLTLVWESGDDDRRIIDAVKQRAGLN